MRGSVRVGRLAGIPVGVHPLWFVIVALIALSLGGNYYPAHVDGISNGAAYLLGLVSALLLFASIVLHELGHSLVARRYGLEIEEIDLWLLGGVAVMKGTPREPRHELRFALAGPGVSVLVAAAFGLLALILSPLSLPALQAVIEYQALINAVIAAFNMLPAFPMDGGRVMHALLWRRSGDRVQATVIAAATGRAFGVGFIALALLGLLMGTAAGLWFGIVGFFLVAASGAEAQAARTRQAFEGRRAEKLMSKPAIVVPAGLTVDEAVRDYFVPHRYTAFPVVDPRGKVLGLVSLPQVQAVPAARRPVTLVEQIADRDPELLVGPSDDVADLLERPAFGRVGRAIVVGQQGESLGLLSVSDVQRALRLGGLDGGRDPDAVAPGPERTAAR